MTFTRKLLLPVASLGLVSTAYAHGLIQDPPSRNWFCGATTKPDQAAAGQGANAQQCASAFANDFNGGYQFMSVLTHTRGRASVTPLPKNVCGFDSETWKGGATPWDRAIDWPTNKMTSGRKKITWNISWGSHFLDTDEFRYWITKPDFQFVVGRPLTWNDFEAEAFCVLKYDDSKPNANPDVIPDKAASQFQTYCNVPARQGRHVIYGEWGRNQWTFERFHSCMDVVFDGTTTGTIPVESKIQLQPNLTQFVGASTIALDGSASLGGGLSYQWSVDAGGAPGYQLEDATKPIARLTMANPTATRNVKVSLLVKNANGSSSVTQQFSHSPAPVSQPAPTAKWLDLGLVTTGTTTVAAGDTVAVRAVLKDGRDLYVPATPITITAANASPSVWMASLAQALVQAGGSLRIGTLDGAGQVVFSSQTGANRIYASSLSNVANAYLYVRSANAVKASYTINSDWGAGYCATIAVTNGGGTAVQWNATMRVEGRVNHLWNASWTQSGDTVRFSGPSWGSTLQPGATFSQAGFCAQR
ncbi:MAG TPA: lytic polysaccharide monooxygenase [Burkholderiaceae bacterium]|nr:lytic polysaccharide monooxygenase [Burkholderiaceae bacterium]